MFRPNSANITRVPFKVIVFDTNFFTTNEQCKLHQFHVLYVDIRNIPTINVFLSHKCTCPSKIGPT